MSEPIALFVILLLVLIIGRYVYLIGARDKRAPKDVVEINGSLKVTTAINENRPVIVQAGALVQADIVAPAVLVAGTVIGNITTPGSLTILSGGVVEGNVIASSILMSEEASLKGQAAKPDA